MIARLRAASAPSAKLRAEYDIDLSPAKESRAPGYVRRTGTRCCEREARNRPRIHGNVVNRIATEASKTARRALDMCFRAFDCRQSMSPYDFLRAMITADYELVQDDDRVKKGTCGPDRRPPPVLIVAHGLRLTLRCEASWTGKTLNSSVGTPGG